MTIQQSTRLETAHAQLEAFSSLSVDAILDHFAPDFTHQVLPASTGMPARDRAAFAEHASGITSIFSKFSMPPQQVFEDPERNAVIVYAKMIGELQFGLGAWENECIMIMEMNEDGSKIVKMQEFVDSAKMALLKDKLGKVMGKEGADDMMHKN